MPKPNIWIEEKKQKQRKEATNARKDLEKNTMLNIRASSQRWRNVTNIAAVANVDLFTVVMLSSLA